MKKKIIWLLVSCLMALSLVLASCAPAVTEEEEEVVTEEEEEVVTEEEEEVVVEEEELVKLTLTKNDGTVVEKWVEEPQYGGTLSFPDTRSVTGFDFALGGNCPQTIYTCETLFMGDYYRGPSGTGESSWENMVFPAQNLLTGALAESWELTDPTTITLKIRQGVHWALDPDNEASVMVGGREFDAYDAEYAMRRQWSTPTSYYYSSYSAETHFVGGLANLDEAIKATDKWTLVLKTMPGYTGRIYEKGLVYTNMVIYCKDVIEEYGDYSDWRNTVGTGPFMVDEYVPLNVFTVKRNPNYWGTDPFFPENQLPYLDKIKRLFIVDLSTRMSAIRTGRLDWIGGSDVGAIELDDAKSLWASNPELEYSSMFEGEGFGLAFRVDKPELPIYDKTVRQALAMAVNQPEIFETIFEDEGEIFTYPVAPYAIYAGLYIPLEEQTDVVQKMWGYDPEEAERLLDAAGYTAPNRFTMTVDCQALDVDMLAIIKSYLADIDVTLDILVHEAGVQESILANKTYEMSLAYEASGQTPFNFLGQTPGGLHNYSMIDDPFIEVARLTVGENYFDDALKFSSYGGIYPYILEQAYCIGLPGPYTYLFWWPWVKNYSGEFTVGYYERYNMFKWVWIDQELKASMGF